MTTAFKKDFDYQGFADELNAIKESTLAKVGQQDADYIRRMIRLQRACEWGGRILMMGIFFSIWPFVLGVLLLSVAKILDNMEIGHNVMHGQYDWMNDKYINSRSYEWDIACDGASWRNKTVYI